MSSKLTTIIVSWNTRDFLQKCLAGVTAYFPAEINRTLVIDNASSDGSAAMVRKFFPAVELTENAENIGFARACNQGMALADSDIILLLNSDCEISDQNLLGYVLEIFRQDEKIGIIGPRILYPNGRLQSAGLDFTSLKNLVKQQLLFQASPLFSPKLNSTDQQRTFEADYVSGSCLFLRKSVLFRVGMFNEAFVMYAEDMDLCYRARQAGFKVLVAPAVSIVHHKSKSTNKNLAKSLRLSVRNNCIFIKKRSGTTLAFIALIVYFIGTAMRFVLAFFRKSASPRDWFRLLIQIPLLWKEIIRDENWRA